MGQAPGLGAAGQRALWAGTSGGGASGLHLEAPWLEYVWWEWGSRGFLGAKACCH